jgi:hypothetical protein
MNKGERKDWTPRIVRVTVQRTSFLEAEPFKASGPILSSAFHVHDIPYRWRRGVRVRLDA